MKRALIMIGYTFVITALWQNLALFLPAFCNVLFLPPIVLIFLSQYFKANETLVIASCCGLVIDVLGGFSLGFNVLFMLLAALLLLAASIGRIHRRDLIYYVMITSFLYRLLFLFVQILITGSKTNLYLVQLLFGPLLDALISLPFYAGAVELLSWAKAFDRNEYYKNRIGYQQ